jgi:hypothetical protein
LIDSHQWEPAPPALYIEIDAVFIAAIGTAMVGGRVIERPFSANMPEIVFQTGLGGTAIKANTLCHSRYIIASTVIGTNRLERPRRKAMTAACFSLMP